MSISDEVLARCWGCDLLVWTRILDWAYFDDNPFETLKQFPLRLSSPSVSLLPASVLSNSAKSHHLLLAKGRLALVFAPQIIKAFQRQGRNKTRWKCDRLFLTQTATNRHHRIYSIIMSICSTPLSLTFPKFPKELKRPPPFHRKQKCSIFLVRPHVRCQRVLMREASLTNGARERFLSRVPPHVYI